MVPINQEGGQTGVKLGKELVSSRESEVINRNLGGNNT
jgi:hypothetical protein